MVKLGQALCWAILAGENIHAALNECTSGSCEHEGPESIHLLATRQAKVRRGSYFPAPTSTPTSPPTSAPTHTLSATIPLNGFIAAGTKEQPDPPRLGIELKVKQPNGSFSAPQQLFVDSGSSALAFCDSSLGAASSRLDLASCNNYGGNGCVKDCPGFVGWLYEGDVAIGDNVVMERAHYATMMQEKDMPCREGANGNFGIAASAFNLGKIVKANASLIDLFHNDCKAENQELPSALPETVKSRAETPLIGIHWSGKIGKNEGTLYLGSDAITNDHYTRDKAMMVWSAFQGYYSVMIKEVRYTAVNATQYQAVDVANYCATGVKCYLDTGAPQIWIPSALFDVVNESKAGLLQFIMYPPDKDMPVDQYPTFSFDVATLLSKNWLGRWKGDTVSLGLPFWTNYYSVFNVADGAIEFVPTNKQ